MTDTKDMVLINTGNYTKEQLEKLTQAINDKKTILRYKFNDDLNLTFNFLDIWLIFFANSEPMAQCDYKDLLDTSGYVSAHQVQCIADCYKNFDTSLLNSLIMYCYTKQFKEL